MQKKNHTAAGLLSNKLIVVFGSAMEKLIRPLLFAMLLALCLGTVACGKSKAHHHHTDSSEAVNLQGVFREPHEGFELITICDSGKEGNWQPDSISPSSTETMSNVEVVLLANEHHNILVGTGVGCENGGVLLQKLKALHVDAQDVDLIYLCSLDSVQVGGLIHNDLPAFPRAQLFVPLEAYEQHTASGEVDASVEPLLANYALALNLFRNGDTLPDNVVARRLVSSRQPCYAFERGDVLIVQEPRLLAETVVVDGLNVSLPVDTLSTASGLLLMRYAQTKGLKVVGSYLPARGIEAR